MKKEFTVQHASVPDRNNCVTEIWYGEDMVAELRREKETVEIQIYSNASGAYWDFEYDHFQQSLKKAYDMQLGLKEN